MPENLKIFGTTYTGVTGIKAKDTSGEEKMYVLNSGGGSSGIDVMFYDYDGSVVTGYSAADFANLTELPANPTHEGLTAQGWNWTLADAKTYVAKYGKLNIG